MSGGTEATPVALPVDDTGPRSLPPDIGLPPCPPPELDPFLDAAMDCFLRFGVRRTSVQDIASAVAVNRTTVYRQVGNVDAIVRQLVARELHRHLGEAYRRSAVTELTPEGLVRLLSEMIRIVQQHPVVDKVLRDERELVGAFVQSSTAVFERIAALITPAIALAVDRGLIAGRDPVVIAQWVARVAATAVLSPPPGDLDGFLGEVLVPALRLDPDR